MKQISKIAIGIFILSLCLYSCKTTKGTAGSTGMVSVVSADMFSSRLKLTVPQEKKKQTLNGTVKMLRDELIQISLVAPVLRTEAVRIEVTPHEMLLIDRINKKYAITPATDLQRILGNQMDYRRLQTILSEAVFVESRVGWNMKQGNVEIAIPLHDGVRQQQLLMELNKITVPAQRPVRVNPPSRYEKTELTELVESIEGLE
ncbi:DUF4292 domain-containing protein [Bacteroides sp. 519]|uniref:DUF4292 domain-containing protein n=1 Tax=Bacteroides sp. 519 TaxID=2302937 RepID=UPI0013D3C0A2|nr:DUF4292 domain-containing protein [Bacteroides sp. 519]